MGCNAFTYQDSPFKIKSVYRRLKPPLPGEPKVAQQIRDVVRDTAEFIFQIYKSHDLAEKPKPDDQSG